LLLLLLARANISHIGSCTHLQAPQHAAGAPGSAAASTSAAGISVAAAVAAATAVVTGCITHAATSRHSTTSSAKALHNMFTKPLGRLLLAGAATSTLSLLPVAAPIDSPLSLLLLLWPLAAAAAAALLLLAPSHPRRRFCWSLLLLLQPRGLSTSSAAPPGATGGICRGVTLKVPLLLLLATLVGVVVPVASKVSFRSRSARVHTPRSVLIGQTSSCSFGNRFIHVGQQQQGLSVLAVARRLPTNF
jgi:hypothetical protein